MGLCLGGFGREYGGAGGAARVWAVPTATRSYVDYRLDTPTHPPVGLCIKAIGVSHGCFDSTKYERSAREA